MIYTSDVFGVSANISQYSYYDRNGLDGKLTRLLRRDVHIAIKGPSKCGKSWLRQKCLNNNTITVQCRIGMTVEDIYRQALSSLGVKFNVQRSSSTNMSAELTGSGKFELPIVAKAEADISGAVEHNYGSTISLDFTTSINNLEFISKEIIKSGKILVIEDFHYLDMNTRNKLAYDLKTFWDYKCKVIIIGVWTQTNLLTFMNPDLTGRIEEISVLWEDKELREVIHKGCNTLNISIDPIIENKIIHDSFGNVGILQSLLLTLVEEEANIEQIQNEHVAITDITFFYNAATKYANQLDGLYQQFAQTLSKGIRKRQQSTGIYALSMEAIVNATDHELMKGLSRNKIFSIINKKEPRIQQGNLKVVLQKLVELQNPGGSKNLVITYDESIDAIFAVDLQLLFYRKHHTMKWPWEEMIQKARALSLFELEDECEI